MHTFHIKCTIAFVFEKCQLQHTRTIIMCNGKKAEVIFCWPFVISITLMPISRKPELNSRHRCLCRRHRHIHCRFLFFLQQIWRVMHVRFIRSRPSRYLKYLQMLFVDSFYFFHSCSVIVSAMCKNCMMQYDDEFS